jgi:hypothetical protein
VRHKMSTEGSRAVVCGRLVAVSAAAGRTVNCSPTCRVDPAAHRLRARTLEASTDGSFWPSIPIRLSLWRPGPTSC